MGWWLIRLAIVLLTLVNVALMLCLLYFAMWMPMLVGTQDKGVTAAFGSILMFPYVVLICAILPWLFLWFRWRVAAVVAAIAPVMIAIRTVVLFLSK
jgi:hypothetical protein